MPGLSGVTGVVAGGVHAMVTRPGQVLGWGFNQVGQLGDGTNTPTVRPTPVLNRHLTGVVQLTAGHLTAWRFVADLTEGAAAASAVGKTPGGGWVLSVRDVATGAVGLLDRWTLAI